MLNKRYDGSGCYRFRNDEANTIYIGSAKNIDKRLKSHFSSKGSNVSKEGYNSTAKVEIIKTKDYATSLALEQFLINEYKPKYNKKDKSSNINSKAVEDEDYYKNLENWIEYIKFREFDFDKIKMSHKQNILAISATYIFFIFTLILAFVK